MTKEVRVRFAPSPTGPLHIGGVRTALFNYLFARQHGGKFILRIEDTDSTRFVEGAEEYIKRSLAWCGMQVDEGDEEGGEYGPYKQSARREIYLQYAQTLVEKGWAYYAFDSADSLAAKRAESEAKGEVFAYGPSTRLGMQNSLTLSPEEVQALLEEREDWVIRFKIPAGEEVVMDDLIRGRVEVQTDTLDDKVLYKRVDRLPTYHLANIVDDHLMEISHVIRGEEWLPSLPLHVLLYEAFGWTDTMPQFAHLPLILKPTGNGKLSKRDGDKMGFPVFPLEWKTATGETYRGYREDGYLPAGFLNMLAMLGWNPGGDREIFALEEMVQAFSLDRVSKAGARFDPEKAKWFNHEHVLRTPTAVLADYFRSQLDCAGICYSPMRAEAAIDLVKDRVALLPDLYTETDYLWRAPQSYDEKAVKKHCNADTAPRLRDLAAVLGGLQSFQGAGIADAIKAHIKAKEWPMGKVMNALRLALVGESRGVDLGEIIAFVGREEAERRINAFCDHEQVKNL